MELANPIFLFERQKITALEDRVIVDYVSLIKEFRVEYKYDDLKSRVVRGKSGDPAWTDIGNFLLGATGALVFVSVFVFPNIRDFPYYVHILLGLTGLALAAYSLRLVKYDKVWFDEKDSNSNFMIKITTRNRDHAERMISYITEKIHESELKSALKVE